MKTVVLVGTYAGYSGEEKEVWGVNRAYRQTPQLSRVYFFDPIDVLEAHGHPDFVEHINGLKIPVITKRHYDEIPLSEAFPLNEVTAEFKLTQHYFTSSPSYMLAHAIYEGYERIILHQMQMSPASLEYYCQKPCMDFWCGIAKGRGIDVVTSPMSFLCSPHLWETGLYGWVLCDKQEEFSLMIATTVKNILRRPHSMTLVD